MIRYSVRTALKPTITYYFIVGPKLTMVVRIVNDGGILCNTRASNAISNRISRNVSKVDRAESALLLAMFASKLYLNFIVWYGTDRGLDVSGSHWLGSVLY